MLAPDHRIMTVVGDGDLDQVRQLAEALEAASPRISVVATAQDGRTLVRRASELGADAVVCEFGLPDLSGIEVAQELARVSPGTQVFLVTGAFSVELVQRAKAAGVREVLPKGERLDAGELARRMEEEVDRFRADLSRAAARGPLVAPGSGPAGRLAVRPAPPPPVHLPGPRQRVIAVYNPKGGVGKSTLAANLAVAFKLSPVLRGVSVALLDFDVEFGNLAVMFNVVSRGDGEGRSPLTRSILSLQALEERAATRPAVEDCLLRLPCGVHLLAAPEPPALSSQVTGELADKALRLIRRYYDLVVVDCGPKLCPTTDAALEQATEILLVTTPEVQAVTNLVRFRDTLTPARPGDPDFTHLLKKCLLVVNRLQSRPGEIPPREIVQATGFKIFGIIPEDPAAADALAQHLGRVAVESYPGSSFATAVRQLANDLCGAYPGAAAAAGAGAPGGLLGRLLGGRRR